MDLKYEVAESIQKKHAEKSTTYQIGVLVLNMKTLFEKLLDVYKRESNLVQFGRLYRNGKTFTEQEYVKFYLMEVKYAHSLYNRIRLESKKYWEISAAEAIKRGKMGEKYAANVKLPQADPKEGRPTLPTVPKGGMYPGRRSLSLPKLGAFDIDKLENDYFPLTPQLQSNKRQPNERVKRRRIASKSHTNNRFFENVKLNGNNPTVMMTRTTKKKLWRPKLNLK